MNILPRVVIYGGGTEMTSKLTHKWVIIVCNATCIHLLHIKWAKTDAAMQNNCPVCYSLSWDQKLFNTKVRRGAVFLPQNAPETVWRLGSARTNGEFTMLSHTL